MIAVVKIDERGIAYLADHDQNQRLNLHAAFTSGNAEIIRVIENKRSHLIWIDLGDGKDVWQFVRKEPKP